MKKLKECAENGSWLKVIKNKTERGNAMSIYNDLLERVSMGAKYKIDLVQKTLKIDGKEVVLEGNLIDETDVNLSFDCWEILEMLYSQYKRSIPSERHLGNRPYFKAVSVEELTDNEIAFNASRNYCQAQLEGFVLLASLSGWFKWKNDKHWFYQGHDASLVCLKEWI